MIRIAILIGVCCAILAGVRYGGYYVTYQQELDNLETSDENLNKLDETVLPSYIVLDYPIDENMHNYLLSKGYTYVGTFDEIVEYTLE